MMDDDLKRVSNHKDWLAITASTQKDLNQKRITPGVPISTTEEAEDGDAVICGYPDMSNFDDDILSNCDYCSCNIIHRPHTPLGPPKICLKCASGIMEIGDEIKGLTFREAAQEYMKRKKGE